VDVQIGPQLYEHAPQELRSRLWIALLDNGTLASSVENSAVCTAHLPYCLPLMQVLPGPVPSCKVILSLDPIDDQHIQCIAADAHRQRVVRQPARIRCAPQLFVARRGPPGRAASGQR
jgi:hypothetical protein